MSVISSTPFCHFFHLFLSFFPPSDPHPFNSKKNKKIFIKNARARSLFPHPPPQQLRKACLKRQRKSESRKGNRSSGRPAGQRKKKQPTFGYETHGSSRRRQHIIRRRAPKSGGAAGRPKATSTRHQCHQPTAPQKTGNIRSAKRSAHPPEPKNAADVPGISALSAHTDRSKVEKCP